jgi:co-chaperonin GroES (HSP10)
MERPKPGDRIAFARHSGAFILGKDGVEYRIVKDKDVVAVIDG